MTDGADDPESAGERAAGVRDRIAISHRHSPGTTALVAVVSVALGGYTALLAADLGLGTESFLAVAGVGAYVLYRQPTTRAVVVVGLYVLAAFLLVTPAFLTLPLVLATGESGGSAASQFTLRLADVAFLAVFVVLAAVPGGLAWRLSTE